MQLLQVGTLEQEGEVHPFHAEAGPQAQTDQLGRMEPGKVCPGGAHQVQMGGAQILAIREGREVADARAVIFDVLDGAAPKPFQIGKVAVAHHHVPQVR